MENLPDYFETFATTDTQEIELSEAVLLDFWNNISPDETAFAFQHGRYIFIEGVKQFAVATEDQTLLYLKTKGWKITLKKNLVKNLLMVPALSGILHYLGYIQFPAVSLYALIPLLFEVENVKLTKKEEHIWLSLPVKSQTRQYKTAEQWYQNLPKEVKGQINELDFKDFIEKLVIAGFAKTDKKERALILPKGKNIFHLTFE